ncbi:hypothetical protein EVAR_44548_1 [Eumeta japonica]|uniref:Uncharacterized protein n=1 Tax=Eumeta variegata TaxID=151549 RepID=A0A4C1XAC6_EUMVA|nr:hypothetical protein EVAR_44548_1 [Eumeta japonica]
MHWRGGVVIERRDERTKERGRKRKNIERGGARRQLALPKGRSRPSQCIGIVRYNFDGDDVACARAGVRFSLGASAARCTPGWAWPTTRSIARLPRPPPGMIETYSAAGGRARTRPYARAHAPAPRPPHQGRSVNPSFSVVRARATVTISYYCNVCPSVPRGPHLRQIMSQVPDKLGDEF